MAVFFPSYIFFSAAVSRMNYILGTTSGTKASDWIPGFLMVIGVVLLGIIFTISVRSKIAARKAAQQTPRERLEQIKAARQNRDDVHVVTAELHDTVQELSAKVINRTEQLEQIIAEADRCRGELQALLARIESAERAALPQDVEFSATAPTQTHSPAPEDIRPDNSTILDPLTRSVYTLADSGKSSLEIAQQLDEQIGKIELILSLRAEAS